MTIVDPPGACARAMGEVRSTPVTYDPGVIALELFDTVPPGTIVHAVTDDSCAPLLQRGEIAIVESDGAAGCIPERGVLFLVESVSGPSGYTRLRMQRRYRIAQVRQDRDARWWISPYRAAGPRTIYLSDGPYEFEAITEKLIGRVVGIYGPSRVGGC